MITSRNVIRSEYHGAPQTIDLLRRAVLDSQNHIVVRQTAEMICGDLDSKDYVSEYLALYRAAKTNEEKRALLRILSIMGGDAALEAIDAALAGGK